MRGETEYGVKALPLGGFVKITGMTHAGRGRPRRRAARVQQQARLAAGHRAGGRVVHALRAGLRAAVPARGGHRGARHQLDIGAVTKCLPRSVKALDTERPARRASRPPRPRWPGSGPSDKVISIAGQPVPNWTQLGKVIKAQKVGQADPGRGGPGRPGRDADRHAGRGTGPHGAFLGIEDRPFLQLNPISGVAYAGSTWGQVLELSGEAAAKLPSALPDLFAKDRAKTAGGDVSSVIGAATTPARWSRPAAAGSTRSPRCC